MRNVFWKAASACSGLRVPQFGCPSCPGACNQNNGCVHAAYKCYVFVEGSEADRDAIMGKINEAGVPCFSGSCSEVYLEKAFDGTGWRPAERLPTAKLLGETSLMFLCHPTLTDAEIDKTCDALEEATKEYGN